MGKIEFDGGQYHTLEKVSKAWGYDNPKDFVLAILTGDLTVKRTYERGDAFNKYDFTHIGVEMVLTDISIANNKQPDGSMEAMLLLEAIERVEHDVDAPKITRREKTLKIYGKIPFSEIIERGIASDLLDVEYTDSTVWRTETGNSNDESPSLSPSPSLSMSPSPEPEED